MNDTNKNILLISYVFPPYYGIGGRRWARHAEYLTKAGYTVHVICAKNPFDKISLWQKNIENNKSIIVHQLPSRFPKSLLNYKPGLLNKLLYKFWISVIPFFTKSNFLDRSVFWKSVMLNKAKAVIAENKINPVIVTGGPFSVLYYATLLKKSFPDLFLLSDWRDPWTWAPNWGYSTLSDNRMKEEKRMERLTLKDSDIITVPTDSMLNSIIKMYPEYTGKIKVVPHFFDADEIPVKTKTKSDKLRLVYYGTTYIQTEHYFKELATVLKSNSDSVTLDMYSDHPNCKTIFNEHQLTNVNYYPVMPAHQLFSKFENYDMVLLVHPDYGKDNISTKFYEIIYSRTPIFLMSESGLASEFIKANELGLHASVGQINEVFSRLISNRKEFPYNHTYDVNIFSLKNITFEIIKLISR